MNGDPESDSRQGAPAGIRRERVSRTLAVQGDRVRFAGRLKAGSVRGGSVAIELEGTTDGFLWTPSARLEATGREWASEECAVAEYAYVRLHARLLGPGGPVGYDTRVEFDPK